MVWLPFRFPLSVRMVDELPVAPGILVSHGRAATRINGCQWPLKFGQVSTNPIRRKLPATGDKWHMGEVVLTISGVKHWVWRAVEQTGWCWTS